MATQEDAILTYRASNIVLAIHSDASYLSEPKSCSCMGGHMFMAGKDNIPFNIGTVLNILQIIWAVMSSVAEAELGALFIGGPAPEMFFFLNGPKIISECSNPLY